MRDYFPLWAFFTDPVLSFPTIGSMLMCLASSFVGVIVFIQKRSLMGEALSHATYPGIILGVLLALPFMGFHPFVFPIVVVTGAFLFGILGLKTLRFLENRCKFSADASLCFVLSTFLGLGVLLVSRLQFMAPILYQKAQIFLYGQAATMLKMHVFLYGGLVAALIFFLLLFYPKLKVIYFDETYAKVLGISVDRIAHLTHILIVATTVIGLRSVGVVLMSGMLIAPAVFARQVARNLKEMFIWGGIVGILSGFIGNYLSVNLSIWYMRANPGVKISLPTGPMILVVATLLALLALLFAGERGVVSRMYRKSQFQQKCVHENLLKTLYKSKTAMSFKGCKKICHLSLFAFAKVLLILTIKKLITIKGGKCLLTEKGRSKGENIIRIHRLWEVYLCSHLGVHAEKVHRSAEEMEHIITPELERQLSVLLNHPKRDPHNQIIPAESV